MRPHNPSIYNDRYPIRTIKPAELPSLLSETTDPPKELFIRGEINDSRTCVSVVGSRHISAYGKAIMPRLIKPLVENGCTIISGLAYGVDALAHTETLRLGGMTIAVLGGGLDDASIYPRANYALAKEILSKDGALISEYPAGTKPQKYQFIARNRIIAGLSQATIVVECATKSGALITADFALNFNREVGAVPGPVHSTLSAGPHKLIKEGAYLVESGEDILAMLNIVPKLPEKTTLQLSAEETLVLKCIQTTPLAVDELCQQTNLPANLILPLLTRMELTGLIVNIGQQKFAKT